MKRPSPKLPAAPPSKPADFPSAGELAALRAWYEGLSSLEAVNRYLDAAKADGESSRGILSDIRKQLASCAKARHQADLVKLFTHREADRAKVARVAVRAIDVLSNIPMPTPLLGDNIESWLSTRTVRTLHAHGIKTLADLTVRIPRRRRWWAGIVGLGAAGARQIEAFFVAHPQLTDKARALVHVQAEHDVVPWEILRLPQNVDGSNGTFRSPPETCTLDARNDYEAVQAWLSLHESGATLRAYSTGLRASELVGVTLKSVYIDGRDEHWLHLVGKGSKAGKVAMPPMARGALDRYRARALGMYP